MDETAEQQPDFAAGVAVASIPDGGILFGRVGDTPVLLTRSGQEIRAFNGRCTHLGAPLAAGLVVDGTIRCPWHHACFDLRSGEATGAPAFDALAGWTVERRGDWVFATGKIDHKTPKVRNFAGHSQPGLVIIGSGAAGFAAAHELRRVGHEGPVTMVSSDPHPPYDRTLLTKDYLEGAFSDDRLPIAKTSLNDLGVTLRAGVMVAVIEPAGHRVVLNDGHVLPYTKLLLATGAEPNRLDVPGADLPHVSVLRSLDDCRALLARSGAGRSIVVIGSSFIGLEAAAALRARGRSVTVVTPEAEPMAKILGPELARAILSKHTGKGVVFRVNCKVTRITPEAVHLADGSAVPADVVVIGIGVKPRVDLAQQAGLAVAEGVVVDACLATSDPDIFAAGDIASWPDPHSGARIRVEHWVVAQRQGQVAARNMLGSTEHFEAVPFFWSKHFDFSFRYVGHAESWDRIGIEGALDAGHAVIHYAKGGRDLAVATVERDLDALRIERRMELRSPTNRPDS